MPQPKTKTCGSWPACAWRGLYLYLDRPEDGLEVLQAEVNSPAWVQLTEDLRGDLLQTLGRIDEARVAYQAALDRTGQVDAGWIRLKLDNLGAVEVAEQSASGSNTPEGAQEPEAEPAATLEAESPEQQ